MREAEVQCNILCDHGWVYSKLSILKDRYSL